MPSTMTENPTPVGYLRGHKAPVICLASCSHSSSTPEIEQLLASGSEDGTGRIWDVRTGRVIKGFKGFDDAVTSVCFPPKQSNQFYLSSGQKVYAYDLRKPDLVLAKAETEFEFSSEEINQIAMDEKNKYLATADDSGEVRVIDLNSRKVCKKFRSKHENICMCVQFRPRRPWEVWSGGMDSKLIMWDFSRGSPSETFDLRATLPSLTPAPDSQPPPLINPPFAHCMSISDNGRSIAAGLGDGSIRLLSAPMSSDRKASTQWTQERLLEGHGYAVAAVEFAKFTSNKLLSAGSDGTVAIWDVSTAASASAASLDETMTAPQENTRLLKRFNALPAFDKINCMTSSRDESGGNMFVAGTGLRKETEGVIAIYAIQ